MDLTEAQEKEKRQVEAMYNHYVERKYGPETEWMVKVWFIEEEIEGDQYCYGDDTYYVKAKTEHEAWEKAWDQCYAEFDDEKGTWDMEILDQEATQQSLDIPDFAWDFYEKYIKEN